MVNPDVGGGLNLHQVLGLGWVVEDQVAQDNAFLPFDPEATVGKT